MSGIMDITSFPAFLCDLLTLDERDIDKLAKRVEHTRNAEWNSAADFGWRESKRLGRTDWYKARMSVEQIMKESGADHSLAYHLGYSGAAISNKEILPVHHFDALTEWVKIRLPDRDDYRSARDDFRLRDVPGLIQWSCYSCKTTFRGPWSEVGSIMREACEFFPDAGGEHICETCHDRLASARSTGNAKRP